MPEPDTSGQLPLLIPEGVRYNCQGCGRCCSGWSVGMTENDYSRIKDIDWGSLHPELADRELFIHREKEFKEGITLYPHFTKPRADGTCPFLIDNLCFIHSHTNEETKPGTCQLFPYTFVETPTGVYMGLSLNSMASVRNMGELLTDQREKLMGYLMKTKTFVNEKAQEAGSATTKQLVANPYSEVTLSGQTKVSWDEFLHVDSKMIETIKAGDESGEDFIQTLLKVEDVILFSIALAKEGKSMTEIADYQPRGSIGGGESAASTNEGILAMVYYLYLVYPSIRASFGDMWQLTNQERFGPKRIGTLLSQYVQYIGSGFSTIFMKNAAIKNFGKINLTQAINYPVKPMPQVVNEFFRRWLYIKIFSKGYFGPIACDYSLLAGFNSLVMCFLISMVFAKGEAMKRKEDEIKIYDLYEVFFRLDREFLTMNQILPQVTVALSVAYSVPKMGRGILEMLAKGQSTGVEK